MSSARALGVAVPWSLSHYIPLNGFHPLYRALFDNAPSGVELHAWDNVKLCNRFQRDVAVRDTLLRTANEENDRLKAFDSHSIAKMRGEYFWPPNLALTEALAGDIEFHHTAPYPSFKRPFVFHCESFAPVFLPFTQQGSGKFKNHQKLRDYYRRIFANPLCLGIFSHIPETLDSLSRFFSDPVIDRKLFGSKIGLSLQAIADRDMPEKTSLSRPTFLFVNSAHQNPANFFRRGGHIVLRFWKELRASGRDGLLMLRCIKPSDEDLRDYGVDVAFLNAETGQSIIWAEDFLSNYEMNRLVASAHFFLLPSMSLHSVSIMQAMALGAIPVVTDTVGTSVYVPSDELGIVLRGVRAALWQTDPNTGILIDHYARTPDLDDSLAAQMTSRILALLEAPDVYLKMRNRVMAHARQQFSGEIFSNDFWNTVLELYKKLKESALTQGAISKELVRSLQDCTLRGDGWARVFESPTQPIRTIYTGQSIVWELGGAIIHANGNPKMDLHDWSVLAQYYSPGVPQTTFANTLLGLGGKYLAFTGSKNTNTLARKWVSFISRMLMPFPGLHSHAAGVLKKLRRCRRFLVSKFVKSDAGPDDIELVLQHVSGYNIIRYASEYYAIPQSEGAFILNKAKAGGYSSSFLGITVDDVLHQISTNAVQSAPVPGNEAVVQPELALEGFHGFNIVRWGGEFHAILQSDGAFEQERLLSKKYSHSFSGSSIYEVKSAIIAGIDSKSILQANRAIRIARRVKRVLRGNR